MYVNCNFDARDVLHIAFSWGIYYVSIFGISIIIVVCLRKNMWRWDSSDPETSLISRHVMTRYFVSGTIPPPIFRSVIRRPPSPVIPFEYPSPYKLYDTVCDTPDPKSKFDVNNTNFTTLWKISPVEDPIPHGVPGVVLTGDSLRWPDVWGLIYSRTWTKFLKNQKIMVDFPKMKSLPFPQLSYA